MNNCNTWLNECYNDCPVVEYKSLTSDMQSTIREIIVYAYSQYSNNESRAKYISDRMSQVYNKVKWSCLFAKTSAYYGYNVWYVNNLYYVYTYKSIKWVVFSGFNN